MDLVLAGINHKTAPIEARERFTIGKQHLTDALSTLREQPEIREALIIDTCNRVEFVLIPGESLDAMEAFRKFLKSFYRLSYDEFAHLFYVRHGYEAVRHLFRVASGLDSLVIGEPQVFGQVKQAYSQAKLCGASGADLDPLFHRVFRVAKRVRTETRISEAGASVVSAAVALAEESVGSLAGKGVLIVGAGEMAKHAARRLISEGASPLFVSNRTHARAVEVAQEFQGLAVRFEDLWNALRQVDVVISSTGCPHFLITRTDAETLVGQRNGRYLVLIDVAVPRDIDPEVRSVQGCRLVSLEDLESKAEAGTAKRTCEIEASERIIDQELARFRQRQEGLLAVPTIVSLRRRAEEIRRLEIARTRKLFGHLTPEQEEALDILTQGLVNKLLHTPLAELKQAVSRPDHVQFLSVVRTIFQLGPKPHDSIKS